MDLNKSSLRSIIRQIINESFDRLEEAQKGRHFDMYLDLMFNKFSPDVPEGRFDNINIMKEVEQQLKVKLDQIFLKRFEYPNFYVVRLGNFIIKTIEGDNPLSFIKQGEGDIKYSYPYLYIYRDTVELIRFGSRFYEPDEAMIKKAQEYMRNNHINLSPKVGKGKIQEEPGKLILISDFDKDNVIDMIDYKNIKRPELPKIDMSSKLKNSYIVGRPFVHNLYGKGIISKTKKISTDETGNSLYDITVNFGDMEKKFRVGKKKSTVQ